MRQDLQHAEHGARVALQRALDSLSVGFERTRQRVEAEVAPQRPGDLAHQFHVPVRGKVGGIPVALDVTVTFGAAPFLTRIQADADNALETVNPTFTFGYELQSDASVMMSGCVREWLLDDRGLLDSARLRVFAVAPGVQEPVGFSAVAHLMFVGYAVPAADDDDGTATAVGGDWPSGGTDNVTPVPWGIGTT